MQTLKLAVKDFKVIMFNTFKKLDFFLKKGCKHRNEPCL